MRIAIDHVLCEGNAVCEALAPGVFDLDPQGQARIIAEPLGASGEVAEEHRPLVERAVESCPRLALSIED